MTAVQNELDDQLRARMYQNGLDREEFERLLQVANQRNAEKRGKQSVSH